MHPSLFHQGILRTNGFVPHTESVPRILFDGIPEKILGLIQKGSRTECNKRNPLALEIIFPQFFVPKMFNRLGLVALQDTAIDVAVFKI